MESSVARLGWVITKDYDGLLQRIRMGYYKGLGWVITKERTKQSNGMISNE